MKKVVTASEIARVEKLAFEEGIQEESLMKKAGSAIASTVIKTIKKCHLGKKVLLLCGKGNNGADAYVAGNLLLEKGFYVKAVQVGNLQNGSKLCQKYAKTFQKKGGRQTSFKEGKILAFDENIIIDGLLGTGFKRKVEGILEEVIKQVNASNLPVVSIDIPSGVNGDTGTVGTTAIYAKETISFTCPKVGFFLNEGWNFVGDLQVADIGLAKKYYDLLEENFFLIEKLSWKKIVPPIKRTRYKYNAGYVIGFAGSLGMDGAAKLSALAAMRSGTGIIRLFVPTELENQSGTFPAEIIVADWENTDVESVIEMCNGASSVFMGPGMGREKKVSDFLYSILPFLKVPTVIDADALYFLSKNKRCMLPQNCILTPHVVEMKRLLEVTEISHEDLIIHTQKYCEEKRVIIILKGSPTFIFESGQKPLIITRGDPGMATAGCGDVLTGIISSLLAQKVSLQNAAILGVYLQGVSGEISKRKKTSYSMIASDLIESLPFVIKKISCDKDSCF